MMNSKMISTPQAVGIRTMKTVEVMEVAEAIMDRMEKEEIPAITEVRAAETEVVTGGVKAGTVTEAEAMAAEWDTVRSMDVDQVMTAAMADLIPAGATMVEVMDTAPAEAIMAAAATEAAAEAIG
jgi:hypothetical protein